MTATQQSIASVRIAAAAADRLKAGDIAAYDVTVPVAITEIMLVVTASNERQVLAVAQEIEKDLYLKDGHREPLAREGLEEAQWVLLDFGDFVVHVMHEDAREFYALDRLWGDCPSIDLELPEHPDDDADAAVSDGDRAEATALDAHAE
ncbi:ribosome silencing factor [Bifidobacterium mongoliense]|uniref:Ribosomal silencing factor RsfS n=2 Tax=Bifidobacterium mongoliense TaxID=518643 RepID=A0A087BS77_9BIFI|nr:ribosome silencing factor [Bifidobacterium mongoliense]KFI73877.1 iojap-like protein [Bifidobacterium mongoliense DSM 21395]MDN5633532.1 ribosome silencing factor [Bifidobacterium mongoliense]MDN5979623.1 ribosome silencing factor [Bifidobacterium mongoliense]MDN6016814.1 ribosome silencing factor [Bifidobacterium mongoliense]MDN6025345.1 ribosome silencing factor [Bifidobacterium mongoliense]